MHDQYPSYCREMNPWGRAAATLWFDPPALRAGTLQRDVPATRFGSRPLDPACTPIQLHGAWPLPTLPTGEERDAESLPLPH